MHLQKQSPKMIRVAAEAYEKINALILNAKEKHFMVLQKLRGIPPPVENKNVHVIEEKIHTGFLNDPTEDDESEGEEESS